MTDHSRPTDTARPTARPAAPPMLRLALILGLLAAFGPLSIDMYLPAFPAIASDLAADPSAVQATLALFFAGLAGGQLIYGPLADRLGRRLPLLAGVVLYTVGSIGCALAADVDALVMWRLVQALGGCAGMVMSRAVIRDLFDERGSAIMLARLMLVMGAAPILAPLIGGQLLVLAGWRSIFWVLTGAGVLALVVVALALPESLPADRRRRQGVAEIGLTYLRFALDRRFIAPALAGGAAMGAMFAYIAGSPFVFIDLYGVGPGAYGWLFGANAAGLILASQLNARFVRGRSPAAIMRMACTTQAVAGVSLAAIVATGIAPVATATGLTMLMVPLFLCIAVNGLIMPNATAVAMSPFGARAGSAAALLGLLQFGTGAISAALVGALDDGSAWPMAAAIALMGLASAGFGWWTPRPARPATGP
ncbi:Bcr/CflA family multidrug efflux MFS transporter [Tistrella sp. BH-R2-4]|uniref:Bcr/CflA family efflux transporter n=2 Tax=Geminicoccaceae TaxID=2066434 RepID=A0ABU9YJ48_9PROT